MQLTIDFKPGDSIRWRGQKFTCDMIVPFIASDGHEVLSLIWRARCAECPRMFIFLTPANATRWAPNRRCDRHHRPGVPVRPKQTKHQDRQRGGR